VSGPSARQSGAETLTIPGPAGRLEAIVEGPLVDCRAYAVVCHPHPLFQGTMRNKVAQVLARSFAVSGITAIRFNFRGVGESEGSFANGDGETEDAMTVLEWAGRRWPGAHAYHAGFSFGAMVALRVAAARPGRGLVTIAPAVSKYHFEFVRPDCPWLILQGDEDDVVEFKSVREWSRALSPPPKFETIAGAGHFFHGRLTDIKTSVKAWLAEYTETQAR
jgi:alpha/beta superfamily hydrolase